ncbi:CLUMA_CG004152, isoform A [Clunio marinus]|uniref:CLUMA_CG004152, isoform A n=1 Tax=Clunio marinus TaxID=568069 RepID=A0A1J1HQV3_9DIPT|nr:CLUMA_CG004152, isoform A [Clunio marinus]
MRVQVVAFVIGLAVFVGADVSHLKHANSPSNTLSNDDHHNFVSIRFNDAGNTDNSNSRYWWLNSETSPFTKKHDQEHNLNNYRHDSHNSIHDTQHQNYNQNPFLNNIRSQKGHSQANIYAHMATLSGSPSEVNSLMLDNTTQTNYISNRYQEKISCYGASQVCAPKDACDNGFISEKDLGLVLSQSNNCDSQLETCCNILPVVKTQSQVAQISSCTEENTACVPSKFCFNGYIDQSVEHRAVRSANGLCYAPEVCCRFNDKKRSAPTFTDSDYAAASTSEVLTKEGYVVNVPSNQYLPSFPDRPAKPVRPAERPEPEFNPDASNNDPSRLKPEVVTQPPVVRPQPTRPQPTRPQPTRPQPTQPAYQPKCSNGAPDSAYPDCCTNGGRGRYCCTNGANNPDCSLPGTNPPYTPQVSTLRPTAPPPRIIPTTQRPYQPQPNQPRPSITLQDQAVPIVPAGCPAAMNCTLIDYCNAIGVISESPVELTEFQKTYRVPMTDCMIMPSRELGKCCRDPNYVDPWPIGQLGQYNADELNAVFDSGAYKGERQKASSSRQVPVRVAPNSYVASTNQVVTRVSAPQQRPNREIPLSPVATPQVPIVQQTQIPTQTTTTSQSCGVRNYNTQPRGRAPLGTGFGEFTWVAMVILESKKALLCGGSIVDKNVVATSANCVHGYRHNDVLIKAGEWRLGSDEEPKPFQIVRVQRIIFHPQYEPKTLEHDIALLYLENDIKYDTHIGPICLDESDTTSSTSSDCVTTGWGKEVLKIHLGNALMQHTQVSVLPQDECQSRLESSQLEFKSSLVCGVTQQDACQVDPGSALACADSSGRYHLKGVYSTETGCNNPNQVVAYTRTDLQWVREILRNPARAAFIY